MRKKNGKEKRQSLVAYTKLLKDMGHSPDSILYKQHVEKHKKRLKRYAKSKIECQQISVEIENLKKMLSQKEAELKKL